MTHSSHSPMTEKGIALFHNLQLIIIFYAIHRKLHRSVWLWLGLHICFEDLLRMALWNVLRWLLPVGAASDEGFIYLPLSIDGNNTYTTEISVGTPPQSLNVSLDFASANLIFYNNVPCEGNECAQYYNITDSHTAVSSGLFLDEILFADGSLIAGYFIEDNITLGPTTLNNTIILMRNASTLSQRILTIDFSLFSESYYNTLGLGPRGAQAGILWIEDDGTPGPLYAGVVDSIPDTTPSFSLWIDPATQNSGALIFGGVDEALYDSDTLITLPIANMINDYVFHSDMGWLHEPLYLGIEINNLTLTAMNSSNQETTNLVSDHNLVGILDSRFEFGMPLRVLHALGDQLGGAWDYRGDFYLLPCSTEATVGIGTSNGTLEFPLHAVLLPMQSTDAAGAEICMLNINKADNIYLPNSVTRNFYIIVDYDASSIGFAKPLNQSGTHQYEFINSTFPKGMNYSESPDFIKTTTYRALSSTGEGFDFTPITLAPESSTSLGLISTPRSTTTTPTSTRWS